MKTADRTTIGATLTCLALIASGCGPSARPPARVFDIQVDAKTTSFSLAASLYFPKDVEAHPGDTLRFTAVDRGEIHTVTFGTLVDTAVTKLTGTAPGPSRPTLASLGLPQVIEGPPDELGRTATQPCFVERGAVPRDGCSGEQQRQPDLTGKQSFYSSGYLAGGAVFAVRLATSITPGVYGFLCLLHGPDMAGRVVVVESARAIAEPSAVTARGATELEGIVSGLRSSIGPATSALPRATVVAGVPARGIRHTQATVFAPDDVNVRRGETVTWQVLGFHTISFNAPQDAVGLVIRASDGSWTLNSLLLQPERSPTQVSGPPPGPLLWDSGTWDGRGFRSSGLIRSDDPPFISYRVTFAEPGTYGYKCLLHPDMEGRIRVVD